MDKMSRGEMQMKLYKNGVYLVNGSELIEDATFRSRGDLKQKQEKALQKRKRQKIRSLMEF